MSSKKPIIKEKKVNFTGQIIDLVERINLFASPYIFFATVLHKMQQIVESSKFDKPINRPNIRSAE